MGSVPLRSRGSAGYLRVIVQRWYGPRGPRARGARPGIYGVLPWSWWFSFARTVTLASGTPQISVQLRSGAFGEPAAEAVPAPVRTVRTAPAAMQRSAVPMRVRLNDPPSRVRMFDATPSHSTPLGRGKFATPCTLHSCVADGRSPGTDHHHDRPDYPKRAPWSATSGWNQLSECRKASQLVL